MASFRELRQMLIVASERIVRGTEAMDYNRRSEIEVAEGIIRQLFAQMDGGEAAQIRAVMAKAEIHWREYRQSLATLNNLLRNYANRIR